MFLFNSFLKFIISSSSSSSSSLIFDVEEVEEAVGVEVGACSAVEVEEQATTSSVGIASCSSTSTSAPTASSFPSLFIFRFLQYPKK